MSNVRLGRPNQRARAAARVLTAGRPMQRRVAHLAARVEERRLFGEQLGGGLVGAAPARLVQQRQLGRVGLDVGHDGLALWFKLAGAGVMRCTALH